MSSSKIAKFRDLLGRVKGPIPSAGRSEIDELFKRLDSRDSYEIQSIAVNIFSILKEGYEGRRSLKLAVLSAETLTHLLPFLELWCGYKGVKLDVFEAPFDTIESSILDQTSELYRFSPDLVWIVDGQNLVERLTSPDCDIEEILGERVALWDQLRSRLNSCLIVQSNLASPPLNLFGNLERSLELSPVSKIEKYNQSLKTRLPSGHVLFDMDRLSSLFGKNRWKDSRYWYHGRVPICFEAFPEVALAFASVVAAYFGLSKKVLVLDLDNTLWGGVVADDGTEGIQLGTTGQGEVFLDFQKYILSLKNRGVILAVCSKNEMNNAELPFREHPDTVLKLEDFAVFKANWDDKATNLRKIADELNVGIDSLVFVDDNPVERDLVRTLVPEVNVPDLPEDPADYQCYLDEQRFFELLTFSEEDRFRADTYRHNVKRKELESKFETLEEYKKSLEMICETDALTDFNRSRVAQLINKSNQFHLTTTRYSEEKLISLMKDPDVRIRTFKLKDRFGDYGLISAVILKKHSNTLKIDTWVMSCRVLSRGLEEFIFNDILEFSKTLNCTEVRGQYLKTAKNNLVSNLYSRLGFQEIETKKNGDSDWVIELEKAKSLIHFIEKVQPQPMNPKSDILVEG